RGSAQEGVRGGAARGCRALLGADRDRRGLRARSDAPYVTPRTRVALIAAAAAAVVAGVVVGVTLATRSDVERPTVKAPPFVADPTAPAEITRDVRDALAAWPAGTV